MAARARRHRRGLPPDGEGRAATPSRSASSRGRRSSPRRGASSFDWLDDIMDRLAARGFYAFLATPSGGQAALDVARSTPRCGASTRDGPARAARLAPQPLLHARPSTARRCGSSTRSSPSATRATRRSAGWHISNEYSGACYCDLCLAAFRAWLKTRYAILDALNRAWWTAFWSQTFQSWDQIDPRESPVDGLQPRLGPLRHAPDGRLHEARDRAAEGRRRPTLPVTTNMMSSFVGLDYWRFADVCDRMSWDAYPHAARRRLLAAGGRPARFHHDLYRTMKGGLPFILMESTPVSTNWQPTPQLKRPGQHRQEMLLAIGHGADTTMYFQWRKSLRRRREVPRRRRGPRRAEHDARLPGRRRARRLPEAPRRRRRHDGAARGRASSTTGRCAGRSMHTQGPRQAGAARPFDKEYIADLPATTTGRSGSSAFPSTSSRACRPSTATSSSSRPCSSC